MKICPTCQRCYEDADNNCSYDGTALVGSRHGSRFINDKYRLDRLLGRGGMGAVYSGTHVDLDRHVAIKLLLPDFTAEPYALERFRREARAAARLNHQNIADTYDYGTLPDGGAYIIMELVGGQSLRDYMNATGALSFKEALEIARQTADGIEAAHLSGIVHRDLKPGNIILTHDHQDRLLIKVVDFGVAKLKEHSTTTGALTASGSLIGTPRYMAPEQCSGHPADARSDIYSLGIILYEMLAGRPPFDAPTATAIAIKHIQQTPPPLREFRADVPDGLERLVMRLLNKDPSARTQTAAELAFDLAEIARALPSSTLGAAASSLQAASPALDPQTSAVAASVTNPHSVGLPHETNRAGFPTGELTTSGTGMFAAEASAASEAQNVAGMIAQDAQLKSSALPAFETSARPSSAPSRRSSTRASYLPYAGLFIAFAAPAFILSLWYASHRLSAADKLKRDPVNSITQTETRAKAQRTNDTGPVNASSAQPVSVANPERSDSSPSVVETSAARERVQLSSLLKDWIAATNARDLNRQMSFYAPVLEKYYLKSNTSAAFVRADKAKLFAQTKDINVRVGEPTITFSNDNQTAVMRYTKDWAFAGARNDSGEVLAELRWSKTKNGWKITSERDLR